MATAAWPLVEQECARHVSLSTAGKEIRSDRLVPMLRLLYSALAAALLTVGALQAPFAHVHPKDPGHHHSTGFTHAHLDLDQHHDKAEGPEIEKHADDELTVYLEWAPAAAPRIDLPYVEVPFVLTLRPVITNLGSAPEFTPHAHSPPSVRLLPARSPPV